MDVADEVRQLAEDARGIGESVRSTAKAHSSTVGAFRRLFGADLLLARQALIRGLVYLLLTTLLAGTTWILVVGASIFALNRLGLSYLLAMLLIGLVNAGFGYWAWRIASAALNYADLEATRRQLDAMFPSQVDTAARDQIEVDARQERAARHLRDATP